MTNERTDVRSTLLRLHRFLYNDHICELSLVPQAVKTILQSWHVQQLSEGCALKC